MLISIIIPFRSLHIIQIFFCHIVFKMETLLLYFGDSHLIEIIQPRYFAFFRRMTQMFSSPLQLLGRSGHQRAWAHLCWWSIEEDPHSSLSRWPYKGENYNAVVTIIKWHYCIPVSISQHMKGRYGHFHVIIFKHFFEQTFVIQSSGHKSSNQNTKPEESNDNFVKHNLSPKIFTWTLRLVFQSAGEHKDVLQEKLLERRKIYHHMAIQKLLASYNYEDWLFDGDMETEGKTLL